MHGHGRTLGNTRDAGAHAAHAASPVACTSTRPTRAAVASGGETAGFARAAVLVTHAGVSVARARKGRTP